MYIASTKEALHVLQAAMQALIPLEVLRIDESSAVSGIVFVHLKSDITRWTDEYH